MIDNELDTSMRALLAAGREQLGPDPETISRLRSRIDSAVAATPPAAAKAFAVKLTVIAVAATVGAGLYRAHDVASVATTMPAITAGEPEAALSPAITLGTQEPAPPPEVAAHTVQAPASAVDVEPPIEAPTAPPSRLSLAREIELVDQATLGLRAGKLSTTLDVIGTYELETRGQGQLAHEAAALKVEALCRTADSRAVAELAAFSQRWPRSPQWSHLSATCAKEKL